MNRWPGGIRKSPSETVRRAVEPYGFTLAPIHPEKSVYQDKNGPVMQSLLAAYRQETGDLSAPLAIGGGTYVHNLKNGVAFGAALPETENHMHGPDEFAVVDELTMSAKIFAQVIVDLCC